LKKFKKKLIVLNALFLICFSSFILFADTNTPNKLIKNDPLENPSPKLSNQIINITSPENKTYTTSMGGYYPATYGFECDANNDFPKGWYENSGTNGYAKVIDGIGGHNKVLECYSSSLEDSRVNSKIFFDPQEQGSIEFWWYKSSSYTSAAIVDFLGENGAVRISIRVDHTNDKVEYQPSGGYLDTGYSDYTDNKWMYFRIDFNCSSDTYSLWIDHVLYLDNIEFIDSKDETGGVNQMRFDSYNEANAVLYYVDAISFSWDPNYDIWNNLNEGLLLSFQNSTVLDWIGYSLDGQPNKTIFGNTTIPIPEEGIHSIQVYGNDTLAVSHDSDIRYFTIDFEIEIITPEDKMYEEPMSGYYPGSFGFENTKNGSIPEDWVFASTDPGESFVIDEVDGHNNVVKLKHGGTLGTYTWLSAPSFNASQVSVGTVEWWMYYEDNGQNHGSAVSINRLWPWLMLTAVGLRGNGSIMYYNGGIQSFYGSYGLDTWYHFKLDLDCSTDKYNITVDGTPILFNIDFNNDLDYFDELHIASDQYSNCSVYYDAFGYSWDPGYTIGDNFNEGLLLSFTNETALDWIGYSLDGTPVKTVLGNATIPMPSGGEHIIKVLGNDSIGTLHQSPLRGFSLYHIDIITPENKTYYESMEGYYPATYGFENDNPGDSPDEWTKVDTGTGYIEVYPSIGGHNRTVIISDQDSNQYHLTRTLDQDQEFGVIEYWLYMSDVTQINLFQHRNSSFITMMNYRVESNKWQYRTSGWNDMKQSNGVDDMPTPSINTWYHVRIDFECGSGGYLGLNPDSYRVIIDGISSQELPFENNGTKLHDINCRTDGSDNGYSYYVDAFGFSWDPDYNIGANLNEGLLLSFENSTALKWVGYSIDDQATKTILGNTTLRIHDGDHSIQVFGKDTSGINYESDIHQFSIYHINITTPENKTYYEPMSGYYPATYGFENVEDGALPTDWAFNWDGTSYVEVDDTKDGHNKVLHVRKIDDGAQYSGGTKIFENNATAGTVEFWLYKDTNSLTDATKLDVKGAGGNVRLLIENQDLYRGDYGSRVLLAADVVMINTWYHIRIDFNLSQGGWQVQLDNTWYGSGYSIPFTGTPTEFWGFGIGSHWSGCNNNYGSWLDALGYSWDSNYNIGDNLNEGLLLSFENSTTLDWRGYSLDGQSNITINGNTTLRIPSDGDHTIQLFGNDTSGTSDKSEIRQFSVYHINVTTPENKTYYEPMSGYYPATYGFENDTSGEQARDWWTANEANCDSQIIDYFNGHNDVYELSDNNPSNKADVTNSFGNKTHGTIEVWFLHNATSYYSGIYIAYGAPFVSVISIQIIPGDILWLFNGTNPTPVKFPEFGTIQAGTWYHLRVDFRIAGAPYYMGLSEDSYIVSVDGIKANEELTLTNTGYPINELNFHTGWSSAGLDQLFYFDAVGYSWDPNNELGDNMNEGLLTSFENSTALDWTGYSLDHQSTKTIMGNASIPMLEIGLHTIQLFGNDSTGTIYNSDLRYFTVDSPFKIITPENNTYYEPMSGYYPATYGFENDENDVLPAGWVNNSLGGSSEILVKDEKAGHNKVLHFNDPSSVVGTYAQAYTILDTPQTNGSIEYFVFKESGNGGFQIDLRNSTGDYAIIIGIDYLNDGKFMCRTSPSIVVEFGSGKYSDNIWFHIRIDFDLNTKKFDIYLDGVKEIDQADIIQDVSSLFDVWYHHTGASLSSSWYIDALGFSWSTDYNIGDNLQEGLLLSFKNYIAANWTGYSLDSQPTKTILGNTTIPLPGNKQHTIQVYGTNSTGTNYQSEVRYFSVVTNITIDLNVFTPENKTYSDPMGGYYPATYGFEDDKGKTDTSISFVDGIESDSNVVNVSEELDGHKDFLDYQDDNYFYNNFSSQTTGYIDFWFRTETSDSLPGDQLWISVKDSTQDAITLQFFNGEIRSHEDGTWSPSPGWYFYSADTWYHIKILFNCSSETYSVWINNVLIRSEKDFVSSSIYDYSAGVEELRFDSYSSPVRRYFDAIGYSWDSSYNVNDNLNEGLLLSYGNYTNLEWQGYSLDGQPTKTILGNSTIPMPGNGNHSIQVFANDSFGFNYLSDIRYFTVNITITIDTSNPVIIFNSPHFNDLFGSSTPSFNLTIIETNLKSIWYTLDGGLINTTILGQIGVIDQAIWNNVSNGTIIIRFYANDEVGNIGFAEVNVRKDILAPSITINTPSENGVFQEIAPNFDLSISDGNLDSIWYTLDSGLTNIISLLPTGTIDQTVWESYSNGTVTIKFYANDTIGNIESEEATIQKDILEPVITIINPEEGDNFGASAPFFSLDIFDGNLDLGKIWYTIDDSIFKFPCNLSGQISLQLWNALPSGFYTLTFYASDIVGNEGFSRVTIVKRGTQAIYGFNNLILSLMLILGVISIIWQIRKKIK